MSPALLTVWCGDRNGRRSTSGRAGETSPATEWMRVVSSASSNESGGRMPGRQRLSRVLPEPGGPTSRMLWPARGGDLERTPRELLPAHLFEAALPRDGFGLRGGGRDRALQRPLAVEVRHHLGEAPRREDLEPAHERRLRGVGGRHDQPPLTGVPRRERDREHAAHVLEPAVERKLAHEEQAARRLGARQPLGGEQTNGDRQVEGAPLLAQVRRREVHGDPPRGEREPRVHDGRPDAVAALAHRLVRQPHGGEAGKPVLEVRLDEHRKRLHPEDRGGAHAREHLTRSPRPGRHSRGGVPVPSRRLPSPPRSRRSAPGARASGGAGGTRSPGA